MKKKVYINVGHSDKDPGAVGYERERDLNVRVAEFQRDYLLANYDVEVRMNPGTMYKLMDPVNDANAWGADLFDSKHFNAGGGDGWEGLVYSSKNVAMGKIFEKHVLAAGQNSRGVKLRPELTVLARTNMPAIINEGAFVDNKKDIQDWNEDHELKKLAIAYAEADAEYLELEKITSNVPDPEPEPVPVPDPAPAQAMYRVFGADGKQKGAYREEGNAITEVKKQLQAGGKATITLGEK